ncbi:hypothetical protein E2P81_ATG03675 [Venturia nashicola]|uniref:Uncharacterized protein n=1 Tax=Venturia nashicola TaxID=86259 RepID=A0A4Z1PJT9_9PEZI|nr:hypothetical protein E6O75_ATG03749 [Venturia nashicola]TLD38000.1 hypothetical protein E2P81_ATG03675 [Venturia nashicola]
MFAASEGAPNSIEDLLQRQLDYIQNSEIQLEPPALTWIESLFPAVIALASFGGSITFSVIPTQLESSHNKRISNQEIRNFLALAWLFFALARDGKHWPIGSYFPPRSDQEAI